MGRFSPGNASWMSLLMQIQRVSLLVQVHQLLAINRYLAALVQLGRIQSHGYTMSRRSLRLLHLRLVPKQAHSHGIPIKLRQEAEKAKLNLQSFPCV